MIWETLFDQLNLFIRLTPYVGEREQEMPPKGKKKDEKPEGRSFREILLEEMKKLKKTG